MARGIIQLNEGLGSSHHAASLPNPTFDNLARDLRATDVSNTLDQAEDFFRRGHSVGPDLPDKVEVFLGEIGKSIVGSKNEIEPKGSEDGAQGSGKEPAQTHELFLATVAGVANRLGVDHFGKLLPA